MKDPIVSIIISNYNHAHYLKEALDAIFQQDFLDVEVLLIDDHSSDHSIEVIQNYQLRYPSIRLYKNSKNMGPNIGMNQAMKKAKGSYVILSAADDLLLQGGMKQAVTYFNEHPEIQVCVTNPSFFEDRKPYVFEEKPLLKEKTSSIFSPSQTISLFYKTKFWLPTHSSMYRKEILLKYGPLDLSLKWITDWYLNHRIACSEIIGFLPISLAALRLRKDSYSAKSSYFYKEKKKVYLHLMQKIESEKKEIKKIFQKTGLLTQMGNLFFFFLCTQWRYISYLPFFILKKIKNVKRKLGIGL